MIGAVLVVVTATWFIIFNTNMGNRLMLSEKDDGGSIDVRLQLFEYVMTLKYQDLMFGMSFPDFEYLKTAIGVMIIENFWLNYIFLFGIVVLAIFTFAYFFVIKRVFRDYALATKLVLVLGILVVMSSSIGLYSNYRSFLMLLLCGYVFSPKKNMLNVNSKYSKRNDFYNRHYHNRMLPDYSG